MTQQPTTPTLAELVEHYIADGNYVHRVRQGYRSYKESEFAKEPRAMFGSYNKTNKNTQKRFSYYENK